MSNWEDVRIFKLGMGGHGKRGMGGHGCSDLNGQELEVELGTVSNVVIPGNVRG